MEVSPPPQPNIPTVHNITNAICHLKKKLLQMCSSIFIFALLGARVKVAEMGVTQV